MAMQTFAEALERDNQPCELTGPDGTIYEGFFANIRVNRGSLPQGWHAYDIRDEDSNGEPCEVRNGTVFVNHFGTFCTQMSLPLEPNEGWYTYTDGTADFELNFS